MRIAFVAYDRPGYRAGPIVNARRLLPTFAERGHDVTAMILYHGSHSPSETFLRDQNVNVVTHPWVNDTEYQIRWFLSQLTNFGPDVFVPNISVAGFFASRWCRTAGIPTISAFRSPDAFHLGMVEQFITGPEPWAVSGCVCVSQRLHDVILEQFPKFTRTCTIPSGVPLPLKIARPREPHEKFRIVFIGRLEDEAKRITDTVRSMISLAKLKKDISFGVIGHGSKQQSIQRLVNDCGLADRIEIMGTVPPEELHDKLVDFHAIVLFSDYEGMPGSLMDGMACGLVPICTPIPGIEELVEHDVNGMIVADRTEGLRSSVELLADNPERWQQMSKASRAKIESGYSLECAATAWEQFMQALLEDAGPRKKIRIPDKFDLPPVRPGLEREDFRMGWRQRLHSTVSRTVNWLTGGRSS